MWLNNSLEVFVVVNWKMFLKSSQFKMGWSVKCNKTNDLISVFDAFAARVGKTSLIMSLVSEEFPEEVEHFYLFSKFYFYPVI